MGFWVRRLPPGSFSTSHASRSAAEARSKMHGRSKVYFESCDVCRCALAATGPSVRTEAPAGGTECVSRGTPAPCGRCREAGVGRRAKKRATVSFGRPKSPGSRGSSEEECEPRRWRSADTGKGGRCRHGVRTRSLSVSNVHASQRGAARNAGLRLSPAARRGRGRGWCPGNDATVSRPVFESGTPVQQQVWAGLLRTASAA